MKGADIKFLEVGKNNFQHRSLPISVSDGEPTKKGLDEILTADFQLDTRDLRVWVDILDDVFSEEVGTIIDANELDSLDRQG